MDSVIELYSNLKPAFFIFSLLTLEPFNNITDISPKNNFTRNAGALGRKLVFPNDCSSALEKSFIEICSEETALKTPLISFVFKMNSYNRTKSRMSIQGKYCLPLPKDVLMPNFAKGASFSYIPPSFPSTAPFLKITVVTPKLSNCSADFSHSPQTEAKKSLPLSDSSVNILPVVIAP